VYGRGADETIRKISKLCSGRELEEWWDREIAWSSDTHLVLAKSKSRLAELLRRAKDKRQWFAKLPLDQSRSLGYQPSLVAIARLVPLLL